jgi:hypothetical protein
VINNLFNSSEGKKSQRAAKSAAPEDDAIVLAHSLTDGNPQFAKILLEPGSVDGIIPGENGDLRADWGLALWRR